MKALEIVELGDPTLRKACKPVKNISTSEIQELVLAMFKSLEKAQGVGLAAPQIGLNIQLFLASPQGNAKAPYTSIKDGLVVFNPRLEPLGKKTETDWEGCLSIPGFRAPVKRFCKIKLQYTNFFGEEVSEVYEDFDARVIQHEYDHLQGVLYLDHLQNLDHLMTENYFTKLIEEQENKQ